MDHQVYAYVVGTLNERFGDSLSSLNDVDEFLEVTEKRKNELERKLSATSEETDKGVIHVLQESKRVAKETKLLSDVFSACKNDIEKHLTSSQNARDLLQRKIEEIQEVSKLAAYLQWMLLIYGTSQKIAEELLQSRQQEAIQAFQQLVTLWNKLHPTGCTHLLEYLANSIHYWFNIFKQQLGRELELILEQCHWPVIIPSSVATSQPTSVTLAKLKSIFYLLLKVKLPNTLVMAESDGKDQDDQVLVDQLLPLQLMFTPFYKRFVYHFMKSHKTNRIEKPEWYLTQILAWIRDNSPFLQKYIQPLIDDTPDCIKAKVQVELMRSLVKMACNKLQEDRDRFLYDDALLTHYVDELLLFVKELQSWGYMLPSPNVLNILTSKVVFCKWLTLESKFAEERMDDIFSGEHAWKCRYPCSDDVDELKVPEFAESFMTMLLSMTERYELLSSTRHQAQFLELQLKLLDDFRLRLQQLRCAEVGDEPLSSRICSILNAVYYVELVLGEWSNLPFFIKLHCSSFYLHQGKEISEASDIYNSTKDNSSLLLGSIFENTVSLLQHMQADLLEMLKKGILCDVKAKSRAYRSEKWFSMAVNRVAELTPSAFFMLKVLKDKLHCAHEMISEPVFLSLVSQLATEINLFIFEEVILQNLFSEGGALQLQKDVGRNLIPIFGNYLDRPDNFFSEVKEACILLSLPRGSAMLLKETVQAAKNARESLEELGVDRLSESTAIRVLKQRTDM